MRIVLDTNVLVSGLLNPHGPPGRVLDLLLSGALRLLFDDRILSEYREVLRRPRVGFAADDVAALLELLEAEGEAILAAPLDSALPDPDDAPFLEVAITGRAETLVTGNVRHFREAAARHGIGIETPAELVARWR